MTSWMGTGKSCSHGRSGESGRVVLVFAAAAAPGTAPWAGFTTRLSPHQRLAIANAYDEMWDRDPPGSTRDQREACELARSRAASRGWAPPQAWDDAQIDQPDGRPSPNWKPRNRTSRRAVDIVEDAQFVRDHGGYRDADNTQIAMRLGVSRDQIDQAYCRARRYASRTAIVGTEAEALPHSRASAQAEPREAEP